MPKRLEVITGPDQGRTFAIGSDVLLVGRSRATETQLIDPHVSRVHCQVQIEGERCILTDYDSGAGTFVNGKRVDTHVLQAGDIIRVGQTRLQYFDDRVVPATAAMKAEPTLRTSAWAHQLVGQKLLHYKIGPLLARGKSGYVFHARDTRKNLAVAIKVFEPALAQDEKAVQRFVQAMKLVLPIKHPNIVRTFGAGKTGMHCWVAMEYVPGDSLAAVIGRVEATGLPDWRNVLRVGAYLARALHFAHSKKLLHLHVTPQNILVGRDVKETKLIDLMLASAIDRDPTLPVGDAGEPSEDLPYMSPEMTDRPRGHVDARADLYGLGATLYALLSGRVPFQGDTTKDLITRIKLEAPPSLRDMKLGSPESFNLTLLKLLAKRPEDRPASAKHLRAEIEAIAKENGVPLA